MSTEHGAGGHNEESPVTRFSKRAADYVLYRPTYPSTLFDWIDARLGKGKRRHVADIGAGTGMSTEPFLERGYRVTAVEPNAAMREQLGRVQERFPALAVLPETAERTGIPTADVDLVFAAQAFHWFDPEAFRAEAQRILTPGGGIALAWNDRLTDDSEFSRAYEDLLLACAPDYANVSHKWTASQEKIASFFEGATVRASTFDNAQTFGLDGLRGRARSSSYVPAAGTHGHDDFYAKLDDIFERYAENGTVRMVYRTRAWFGVFGS